MGDLIVFDVIGTPSMIPTVIEGVYYVVIFTDYATKVSFMSFIKSKAEASTEAIKLIKKLEIYGIRIKRFRTDNGLEYNNARIYCNDHGILWFNTQVYVPDMNRDSEKVGGDFMKKARCILQDAKLLNSLWGEAFKAACYLRIGYLHGLYKAKHRLRLQSMHCLMSVIYELLGRSRISIFLRKNAPQNSHLVRS